MSSGWRNISSPRRRFCPATTRSPISASASSADPAGAVVALGTRDRLDLIYVELARSKHGAMLRLTQGSPLPITSTAMGRALIAGMPEDERNWLLSYIKRQEAKNWPKVKANIERAIRD